MRKDTNWFVLSCFDRVPKSYGVVHSSRQPNKSTSVTYAVKQGNILSSNCDAMICPTSNQQYDLSGELDVILEKLCCLCRPLQVLRIRFRLQMITLHLKPSLHYYAVIHQLCVTVGSF